MFPMPMANPWTRFVTGPIIHPAAPKDPTVRVKLYSWSSEEFPDEHALVYTSRFDSSDTCVSYWRANREKVLFTLQDCLCIGNPVILDMEIQTERDRNGFYKLGELEVHNRRGKFIEIKDQQRGLNKWQFRDTLQYRIAELKYWSFGKDEADIDFSTGFAGGQGLEYSINIECHPLKGIEVDLDGPECYYGNPLMPQCTIGYCSIKYVVGKPPRDVLLYDQANVKRGKEISGASSSSSTSAILNAGNTRGSLNGSNFTGCKINFGRLNEEV